MGGGALLAEVDLTTINLVKHDCRDDAKDLECEVGGLDDIDSGDEAFDDKREAGRVLDSYLVCLAANDDCGVVAAADEDRLRQSGVDLDRLRFLLVVFLQKCRLEIVILVN